MNPVMLEEMKKTPYLSQFDCYFAEGIVAGKSLESVADTVSLSKNELILKYSQVTDKVSRLYDRLFPTSADGNEVKVKKYLKQLGFHMPALGVRLLYSAILIAMENPSMLDHRPELYLMVSKKFGISVNTVRSRISTVINAAVGRYNALPQCDRPEFYQVGEIQEMIRRVNISVFIETFLSYMEEQQ